MPLCTNVRARDGLIKKGLARSSIRGVQFHLTAAVLCFAGCSQWETRFEVTTFGEAGGATGFTEPRFEEGSFRVDARKNYVMVFEVPPEWVSVESDDPQEGTAPNDAMVTSDQSPLHDEVLMSQIIQVEVFWRPLPGRTYAQRTQTNANILYCLIRGESSISYEGAGFVYFEPSRDGNSVEGRIESAELFPTRFTKDPIDLFGPCHLTGSFRAVENKRQVATIRQQLRKLLGPPMTSSSSASAY